MNDIVYILKNNIDDKELIYSVRSVCQNFPYNRIWFAGGKPKRIIPDNYMSLTQKGCTKWDKVTFTLKQICLNDEITENFWLFNDDFFIMQPVEEFSTAILGTIRERIEELKNRYGSSLYQEQLERTERILKSKGYDTLDYALHVPILINRKKALETIEEFKGYPMFRCLYGNYNKIEGVKMDDVKIYERTQEPTGNEIMLSTTNDSFRFGKVGKYIKQQFPNKCRYER